MDSFIPIGGYQLPLTRRLSRLYNDTKKSSDFLKEPLQNAEDPEIKGLHRKLRIQKDRLVSWGLEWSDPSQTAAEIDESLHKAGLSEVVGSIMSTIKETLAEVEPMWMSSRSMVGGKEAEKPIGDKKVPIVPWDKARFADLIQDLTVSIDTLYDLSRTRSSAASSHAARSKAYKSSLTAEDLRPFESTRMQTPQVINPRTLTNLKSMQAEPMSESTTASSQRDIVYMSKQAYSELTQKSGSARQTYSPLLLEHAHFDPIYSTTGIMPSMSRFEKLSAGLQAQTSRAPGAWIGLPQLLGYYEDMESSRLGLVYHFPPTFNPVTFENLTQNPLCNLTSLADMLDRNEFEPKLEAKFRLASNLANTVFDMHARGITHGNLNDSNISFCHAGGGEPGIATPEIDIRKPLVSSFDLFSELTSEPTGRPPSIYRHALDPRTTPSSPLASKPDSKTPDLYSLAMLLLSIGLWTRLDNLASNPQNPVVSEAMLEQLSTRCGTLYMKAVQACWNAVEQEIRGQGASDAILSNVQARASRYLEACCILDGVSGLEERLDDDLRPASEAAKASSSKQDVPGPSSSTKKSARSPRRTSLIEPETGAPPLKVDTSMDAEKDLLAGRKHSAAPRTDTLADAEAKQARKMRLYPQVPLAPEAVEMWHSTVMPQVNLALRTFCRKNPVESMEISLEPIGASPVETQPTVLVICTSVSKVRAILRKKLGALFDGTTGFALKVCRGSVVRSRKGDDNRRSIAKGSDGEPPANPSHQERPNNGASIGAWIGDRHLPPVSFGGLVVVDDRTYGMTVHHMLDDPEQMDKGKDTEMNYRSAAAGQDVGDTFNWYAEEGDESSAASEFACEFSDDESDALSDSAITSDYEDESDEEETEYADPGDIPGIEPGCGEGYIITQPAFDDVPDGFYPIRETANEDHLDSFELGEMYASSGIRRRTENGLVHEIDWALFDFNDERLPDENCIPRMGDLHTPKSSPTGPINPCTVVPASSLPGREVQCVARTSGLQSGTILPTITSVKISGRTSLSHTYQVRGVPTRSSVEGGGKLVSLGIPGDSGAWIVDRNEGGVCGHVLAWSGKKRVAYICPMEVLLRDIRDTLEADEVRLPAEISVDPDHVRHSVASVQSIRSVHSIRSIQSVSTGRLGSEARRSRRASLASQRNSTHSQRDSRTDLGSLKEARHSQQRNSRYSQRDSRGDLSSFEEVEEDEAAPALVGVTSSPSEKNFDEFIKIGRNDLDLRLGKEIDVGTR